MVSMGSDIAVDLLSDRLFNPKLKSFGPGRISVENGLVSIIASKGSSSESVTSRKTIDLSGLLVTPGLVDFHTHLFHGQDLGVTCGHLGKSGSDCCR